MSRISLQVNNNAVYFNGMLDALLVAYLPSSSILSPTHVRKISHLPIAAGLPRRGRGRLLSMVLYALCMTKTARAHGNKELLM